MLNQNLNKKNVEEEFVILPDFCLYCDAEVNIKVIERDRFNITKTITYEYFCGAVLTSINHYKDKQPTTGHIVLIKSGCENVVMEEYHKINSETLQEHKVMEFRRG